MQTDDMVNRGIAFIARAQERDGSFLCLTTTNEHDFSRPTVVHAIVPSNIVLSSFNTLPETDTVRTVKEKVAQFLLSQKSTYWSFNYWFRDSLESKKLPYPDDLDDTFCALAALQQYDPSLIDGDALGKIATILTAAEEHEGGPYDMWLTRPEDKERWKLIDLVVNSNIAYFLSLNEVTLPRVTKFIERSIDRESYLFPYCSIYPAIWLISRFYRGSRVKKMTDTILARQEKDGKWENPLQTALALLALHNFSATVPPTVIQGGIEYLQRTQKKNGSWDPYAFYVERQQKDRTEYAGSATLTTALAVEAIYKLKTKDEKRKTTDKDPKRSNEKMRKGVLTTARQRFAQLDTDIKKQFEIILKRVQKMDKDGHIVLLPHLFFQSLSREERTKILTSDPQLPTYVCLASLYGWIAYTIYDDFLDEEGDPKLLSIANVCLREVTQIYERIAIDNPEIGTLFHEIMDGIESANTWETSNCRDRSWKQIPSYGNLARLADRSMGHALGPIAILLALGYRKDSREVRGISIFFRHYLIARQLNDDAHDWEDDLKRGHINSVGANLLRKAPRGSITRAHTQHDFLSLESFFWESEIDQICTKITTHISRGRHALASLTHILADDTLFNTLLAGPEAMVTKTKQEKTETLKFLRSF